MTFTVTVDPNNAFHYAMAQYQSMLVSDIEQALVAGANMVVAQARLVMAANGNVDTGKLSSSITTLSKSSDPTQVTVTVGPSLTEMHPARFNQTKTFNQIGSYLEFGTGPGGPWTWGGVTPKWAGWHGGWTGNLPHPFLVPAKDAMAPSVVSLVSSAVSRRW